MQIARIVLQEDTPMASMVDTVHPSIDLPPAEELRAVLERDGSMVLDILTGLGVAVAFSNTRIGTSLIGPGDPAGAALGVTEPTAVLSLEEIFRVTTGQVTHHSRDLFAPGGIDLRVVRWVEAQRPDQVGVPGPAGGAEAAQCEPAHSPSRILTRMAVEEEYLLPAGAGPAAMCRLLGLSFTLDADAPRTTVRTCYDTFDGRLRSAGRTLVHEHGRLTLLHEGVGIERSEPPARLMVAELPAGGLRDLLTPIVDVRALTPIARIRSELREARVLDDEGKTVVRLVVEAPAGRMRSGPVCACSACAATTRRSAALGARSNATWGSRARRRC